MSHVEPGPGRLHPDLARIEVEYNRILDNFEASHLTLEQARATISALGVVDADGAVWGIDEDGQFVRSRVPGTAPVVTNPALFAAAITPPSPASIGVPWQQAGVDGPRMVGPSGLPLGVSLPDTPTERRPARPARAPRPPREPRAPRERRPRREPGRLADLAGRCRDLVAANRLTAGVVAVMAVVVVATVLLGGRNTPAGTSSSSSTSRPVTSSTVKPLSTLPVTVPTTTPPVASTVPGVTTTSVVALPQFPTEDRVNEVFVALSSGMKDQVAAAVVDEVSQGEIVRNAALWSGLVALHLDVVPDPAAGDGPGSALQVWHIRFGDTEYLTATVHWTLTDTGWLLASWPTFADPTLPTTTTTVPVTEPTTTTTVAPTTVAPTEPPTTAPPATEAPAPPPETVAPAAVPADSAPAAG